MQDINEFDESMAFLALAVRCLLLLYVALALMLHANDNADPAALFDADPAAASTRATGESISALVDPIGEQLLSWASFSIPVI